jgi:hypothetical protein
MRRGKSVASPFTNIAIGIKTFLRDEHLYAAIKGILHTLPGAQIIIADDGRMTPEKSLIYGSLQEWGHIIGYLPFDSGFGKKSNVIAAMNTKPYILIGSDDFDFTYEAAEGVLKLQSILDNNPEIAVASGRVRNRPYEFLLEEKDGVITEHPLDVDINGRGQSFIECDLTVNYSLIRKKVFNFVRWDDDVKIGGGEHGAWFLDVKRAGFKVAYVPGVNINEQNRPSSQEYRKYRARAHSPKRPCFERRGIKRYILGNGQVDYDAIS